MANLLGAPGLAGIAVWGKQHGVSGLYVYFHLAPGVLEGRSIQPASVSPF